MVFLRACHNPTLPRILKKDFVMFHNLKRSFLPFALLVFIVISLPVALYLVGRATNFFGRAFGTPANLVIDAGTSYSDTPGIWRNLAQGGEEKGRTLAPVLDKVKALRPTYIRIDHIYDFNDVVTRNSGQLNFDFSKLDDTVNDILSTGARPFLSLSYMPAALSKSGSDVDLPVNWSEWELLVQKTIEHYSGTLNISDVYYEVWNEPDLFGSFKLYGDKNYLDLYTHSVRGAARAAGVLPFKIGGPATTGLYKNWFDTFFKYLSENSLRLDFFSWHHYSNNIDDFEKDVKEVKTWLDSYPVIRDQNPEFIISEIGHNSKNDPGYDNNFGAIHTIATSAVLEDLLRKSFVFEIKDGPGPQKLWGRWGILTHEKFGTPETKPRYNALAFLNRISGNRLNVIGQGSWVKAFGKTDGKSIKILVVNYDPGGRHFETVPVNFINLKNQSFTFRRTNYGGGIKETPVATDSASWSTQELFNPNTAAILEVIPR